MQSVKSDSNAATTVIADALWFASFSIIWGLLIALWNTWWAIALVPLFALMLAGMAEVVHQSAHGNLFGRSRMLNTLLGSTAAAVFGVDLRTYRTFHLTHHRVVNTFNDPEHAFYSFPAYVMKANEWKTLSLVRKSTVLVRVVGIFGGSVVSTLGTHAPQVRLMRWGIPLSIALIGLLEGFVLLVPLMVIVAWYLPFGLFLLIDFFLAQSEHYGTASKEKSRRVTIPEQYEISWNLRLPRVVECMVMGRNLHAEHHEYPAIHWSVARDKHIGRTLPLAVYLKEWWANGPRVL